MPAKPSAPSAAPVKVTSAHIRRGLRKYFPDGRCGIVFECAQGTGMKAHRHLDALAMDLWPSHGLLIHGIEIKVDRSDWRRELADPSKAEQLARFCDKFWIAAPPGIVPLDELPQAWGLLEGGMEGLRVVKAAEKTPAQPIDRDLLAAVFRASGRSLEADDSALALRAALDKQEAEYEQKVKERAERLSENNSEDAKHWRQLMDALGLDAVGFRRHIHNWDAEKWIATIKAMHHAGIAEAYNGLLGLTATVGEFHKRLGAAVEILNVPVADDRLKLLHHIGRGKKS